MPAVVAGVISILHRLAVLLFGVMVMAWFYPLTRERHARIRAMLE